ncbi:RNA polymerase sigma factor ['Paenibacillus yunnanensis' Narsing Rao et al. 2020]|uniref:RNA polymerase sigma factor n=1 Tax=Paenibacillus tengchongensis TaxID=2608684 RepID=UPI00124BFBB6|nr:RNA polymerase sigma factor [Paenibacillus tengchongensis]
MSSTRKENALMEAGELQALMETYGDDVWNYAYFLSGSRSAADDIAQETFIRAYKYMGGFRGDASVKTWLLRIARGRFLTFRSNSFVRRVTLQEAPGVNGAARSAEDEFLQTSLHGEVWALVLKLPRKDREVLMLHAHYGLSMEEMAGTLGLSVPAVKSRLQRARRKAARCLEKELNES